MTTQDQLDERYGRTGSAARRWTIGVLGTLAVLAVGGFSWLTVSNAMDDVGVDDTAYSINDEHSVTVNFQISAPRGATVACALEAQDEEHGVVGWRIVEIEASDLHARAFRETIPTIAAATNGLVNSCWVT
ncbi:transcriptional regulator [Microbacterium sp. Root61]|uniref:DUF4307 domain-containing protein n=1 Tax=Microbacterium sp. Root61 TaxID=1736570 RepID=UPI0006F419CD|nr:DUF4307 domain-containing protein [Microbacterium sp. Root61]KRA23870.1 transcriptional regulator [Microbacterium sp. Root61]